MTAIVLAIAALAPWLTLLPFDGAPRVLAHVLTLVAAFHGAGLVLAHLARRPSVHPLLAIQWGIATLIALSGVALLLRVDGRVTQTILVCAFAGVHTAQIILRWNSSRARLAELELRWLIVPAGLLALFGILHILGAAGDLGARPFDDDGNVIAQLQRLRETGTLGDPIGYARGSQLGGQVVLAALATVPGDVHLARVLEALTFALALGLACSLVRVQDIAAGIVATLVVVAGIALPFASPDLTVCWTAVGLILALHAMLTDDEPRALLPIAVTAGALITLRFELAPIGLAAVALAWWPQRADRSRSLSFLGGFIAVVLPFALSRLGASIPDEVRALLVPSRGVVIRVAIFLAIAVPAIPAALALTRDRPGRWLVVGGAIAVAGIASQLTGDRPYALRFLWPIAIAGGLVLVISVARTRQLTASMMIVALVLVVLIYEGRDTAGRAGWTRRYLDLAANIEYLRHSRDQAPITGGYAAILRQVPAGATVAVWVARPERLAYDAPYRIIDLRTPRSARLRGHGFHTHASRIEKLLTTAGASYLLLEADDRYAQRVRASFEYRFMCPSALPACADDLEAIALRHPVISEFGGLRLVRLR